MKRSPLFVVALALGAGPLVVAACGPEPEPKAPEPAVTAAPTPEPGPTPEPAPSPVATPEPPPPPAPVVEDMTASAEPSPLPTIKIAAPANDAVLKDPAKALDSTVRLDAKNWPTSQGMSHIHLILDDHPYKAIYDPKQPVKLAELLPAGVELTEGQHFLTTFASRPTHEAVKAKGSGDSRGLWIGKKGKPTMDPKKPRLVYSRPKGSYKGVLAKEILLDFYLFNTDLKDGHKVRYTITGPGLATPLTGEFTAWAPKVVKNLQKGEYEFKLELLDKDGKVVEGFMNETTRKIDVDPTAEADPNAGMPPHTMDATMPMPPASAAPSASAPAK